MKAVDYLKAKGRICNGACDGCVLENNDTIFNCIRFETTYPEQAVEIVSKWAKEHPVKTYLSVLLERFPNAKLKSGGKPHGCPGYFFNINKECPGLKAICVDCWNREYKEEE